MKRFLQVFAVFLALMFSMTAFADTPDPQAMVKATTNQLLEAMQQNLSRMHQDPKFINTLVRQILIPHVDTVRMSQSVLGRQAWMSATPAQQQAFTTEFTTVVIDTYASALNAYTDQTVRFLPMRSGYQGQTNVVLSSQIIRNDGPPVNISYRLILDGNEWKIYDLNVEGVSLLESFRAQFAQKLSEGSTVADLIVFLQGHNTKNGKAS